MHEESISILQKLGNIPLYITHLCYSYSEGGKREESLRILDDILKRSKHEYFPSSFIGGVYGNLGDKDKAFAWLEKSLEEFDPANWGIKIHPMFENLYSDPRWMVLMNKIRLAD